jgi:hypothetical protein
VDGEQGALNSGRAEQGPAPREAEARGRWARRRLERREPLRHGGAHTRLDLAAVVLQRKRKRNLDVVIQVAAYESKQKELAMHRVKS